MLHIICRNLTFGCSAYATGFQETFKPQQLPKQSNLLTFVFPSSYLWLSMIFSFGILNVKQLVRAMCDYSHVRLFEHSIDN